MHGIEGSRELRGTSGLRDWDHDFGGAAQIDLDFEAFLTLQCSGVDEPEPSRQPMPDILPLDGR